jgi:hypothetical protein
MPLVAFKPLKARLVIEEDRGTLLVMKVAVAEGESVALVTGGKLESLSGVVRIRERSDNHRQRAHKRVGSLVYVPDGGEGPRGAGKFQINLALSTAKFEALLSMAMGGVLPVKFFVDAGEKISATETRGMGYGVSRTGRVKVWDTHGHRTLPVTGFSLILPVPDATTVPGGTFAPNPVAPESGAGGAHLAEIADEVLSFQAETRATLVGVLAIIAVIMLMILMADLVLVFK